MIPSDLAARLRILAESAVQPLAPAQEISHELPRYDAGQRFTAQVEARLPDGNFRALVAGNPLTLSLPQAAQAGDVLDLMVVERMPRAIIATPAASPAAAPTATLSRAAQLIGSLLAINEGAAQPALLARGGALLPEPPQGGASLAPLLQQAVGESGLFYEAHQAQWLAGKLPLAALLREPQGRHSPNAVPAADVQLTAASTTATTTGRTPLDIENAAAAENANRLQNPAAAAEIAHLPPELTFLVQQQLDAAASHHLVWQGQVWPGQGMQWQIDDPLEDAGGGPADDDAPRPWHTTLRLTLPRLGAVEASLTLSASGMSVALAAPQTGSANRLRGELPALETALAAAGVPLTGFKAEQHEPA